MDGHEGVVLEKGIGAAALQGGERLRPRGVGPLDAPDARRLHANPEGIREGGHQEEEVEGHDAHDRQRPRAERVGLVAAGTAEVDGEHEGGEDQAPEDDAAFQGGPCRGRLVEEGGGGRRVVRHVLEGEVVAEDGDFERDHGEQCAAGEAPDRPLQPSTRCPLRVPHVAETLHDQSKGGQSGNQDGQVADGCGHSPQPPVGGV